MAARLRAIDAKNGKTARHSRKRVFMKGRILPFSLEGIPEFHFYLIRAFPPKGTQPPLSSVLRQERIR